MVSVVVYHAAESLLPGGFVGVDIFFVISGYLISQLLIRDLRQGTFSIARFYVRRSKRILPALTASALATVLLGLALLTPDELAKLGRGVAATFGFVSNITLWQDIDYFAPAADRNPLLHTWSLAVEEQFYLLWPMALALLWRLGHAQRLVQAILLFAFILSCAVVLVDASAAFFLLPARAWELLAGAAIALAPPRASELGRSSNTILAWGGVSLIALALMALDRHSLFPGWNALLPCLGTMCLIIAGGGRSNALSERALANGALVFVGSISYSLYLWHWPVLSIARITQHGHVTGLQTGAAVVAAVLLAIASWRFVERPFRTGPSSDVARSLWRYGALSAAGVVGGLALVYTGGLERFARADVVRVEQARLDTNRLSGACLRLQAVSGALPGDECVAGASGTEPQVVVWGDSHADALAPAIVERSARGGSSAYQLTMLACPPLVGATVMNDQADYTTCNNFNAQAMTHIVSQPGLRTVVLAARWTLYTQNARFGSDDTGPPTYLVDDTDREPSVRNSVRVFEAALAATIDRLERAGKQVVLIGSVPPIGTNVPSCLARNLMPFSSVVDCGGASGDAVQRLAPLDLRLEQLARPHPSVCVYRPMSALCQGQHCLVQNGSDIFYADDDHLTVRGARFMLQGLTCSLEGPLGGPQRR